MQPTSPAERWGELFVAVQTQRIFPDGKTFVDCTPKAPDKDILAHYAQRKGQSDFNLSAFVLEHFKEPPVPGGSFQADTTRSMSEHIQALWPVLTRQPDEERGGSLLPLPHPYVVPGGRFREIYYWDSYFTMLGLATDGEWALIECMIDNFAHLIDTIGFIPNGNRDYFLTRSQPPFFVLMVELLAAEKGDDVLLKYLPQLRKEYAFWMEEQADGRLPKLADQAVQGHLVGLPNGALINRYYDTGTTPRPESYLEDIETLELLPEGDPRRDHLYAHLRAACESGWDFTARWLADGLNLQSINTLDIVPVDLNALLYRLEQVLDKTYKPNGQPNDAECFAQMAERRLANLNTYCWDQRRGFYCDYNFRTAQPTPVLSLAGVFPLYFNMATTEQAAQVAANLEQYFLQPGGWVSTLRLTGQQWDTPNGWAPLQWMTYQGLLNYGYTDLANEGRDRWLSLNERVYKEQSKMVEKYNVMAAGGSAGGGEYPLQDGFGWSNGVAQRLIKTQ